MKRNLLFILSLFATSMMGMITNKCSAQTIVNADFELWPVGCPYNVAPTSWTNFSTSLGPDQAGTCAGTIVSYQGNSHMNLVWYTGSSLAEGTSQVISGLMIGETYEVGFAAVNDYGLYSGVGDVTLDFYLDGVIIFSTPALVYGGTWGLYTASFVATSSSHTIAFRVNSSGGSTVGSVGVDAVTISSTVSVEENVFKEFNVYPNPSTGHFTIALENANAEVLITDMLGQQVLKTKLGDKISNFQLDKNGVYIIHLLTKQGWKTRKLIVSR